jgi:lipopolysaccharide heptosyltransferase II
MRILIIEVNWLGDVLFSTAAIRHLREKFPQSFIAALVVPRVKEVLENNPYINELIINDEGGRHKGFFGALRLAGELKEKRFDLAVLFHRSFTRALITYLAGIRKRAGYRTSKRWFLLTSSTAMPKKDSAHRVDYYLGIVESLGCNRDDKFYEFFTSEKDEEYIEDFLRKEKVTSDDFVVCLNPGGNWEPKRWPKENFSRLADKLIAEHKIKVILAGGQEDTGIILEITRQMEYNPIIAAGITNLKQSACLFRKVNLVISADSGPLHIAAATGANVIGLFGPTSPSITGPIGRGKIRVVHKGSGCSIPCYDKDCNNNRCMQEITVEDVLSEVKSFL